MTQTITNIKIKIQSFNFIIFLNLYHFTILNISYSTLGLLCGLLFSVI